MLREVRTENGLVRGIEAADPRITAFKGIPFAAPPIGDNRWRAPQPAANWDGVKECYRFAPIPFQNQPGVGTDIYCREWHVDPDIAMSEDCLYLNVWTGAKSADEKRPVVVWFFGGGFQWGYPAEMEFDGERVARRNVVVVTVGYRLNVFGFLAHPQLTKEQPDAPTNFGLLDQQAGVKWVKRNIAAFGGDPDNITIAGQSAGGGSVMAQVTNPANKGLFSKAIVQSGIINNPYNNDGFCSDPLDSAEANGKRFFESMGVSTLEEARKIPTKELLDKYDAYVPGMMMFTDADKPHRMFPVIDNKFVYGNAYDLYLEGKHLPVKLLAGNTADEFPWGLPAKDEADFIQKATERFGTKTSDFLYALGDTHKNEQTGMFGSVNGIEVAVKKIAIAEEKRGGDPVYYYRFEPDIPGDDNPGTFHSCELWFFFETLAKCSRPYVGRHYDLARKMCDYWCNFIKTGDPNGIGTDGEKLPEWKPYTEEGRDGMSFRSEGPVAENKDPDLIKFLVEE